MEGFVGKSIGPAFYCFGIVSELRGTREALCRVPSGREETGTA